MQLLSLKQVKTFLGGVPSRDASGWPRTSKFTATIYLFSFRKQLERYFATLPPLTCVTQVLYHWSLSPAPSSSCRCSYRYKSYIRGLSTYVCILTDLNQTNVNRPQF